MIMIAASLGIVPAALIPFVLNIVRPDEAP